MSDETAYTDLELALVKIAVRAHAKPGTIVEVRPGLEITTNYDGEPIVTEGGMTYALDNIPFGIGAEILRADKKHKETIESLKQSKYLDPVTNPVIKIDPDE